MSEIKNNEELNEEAVLSPNALEPADPMQGEASEDISALNPEEEIDPLEDEPASELPELDIVPGTETLENEPENTEPAQEEVQSEPEANETEVEEIEKIQMFEGMRVLSTREAVVNNNLCVVAKVQDSHGQELEMTILKAEFEKNTTYENK